MNKRVFSAILAAMLLLLGCASAETVEAVETVEQSHDMGDLTGYAIMLYTGGIRGESDGEFGYSRVSYAKKRFEQAGAAVILADTGDALHGLPFATVSEGESIVRLMNAAGYDAMTPGLRDFIYGPERLTALGGEADFALLSSNALAGNVSLLEKWTVIEKDGVKFGLFALSEPSAAERIDSAASLDFADPAEAAKEAAAALKAEGCDVIVALSGLSGGSASAVETIALQTEGLNVILDGARSDSMWVGGVLVAGAEAGRTIGCVAIDPQGKCAAIAMDETWFDEDDADAEIDALIAQIQAEQASVLDAVIGRTDAALDGGGEAETNLGDLAADALRAAADADAALIAGADFCSSIPAGDITRRQITAVFPDGRFGVTVGLTGAELAGVLEKCAGGDETGFAQVSGLTFKLDAAQEAGTRVSGVSVGGEALDAEKLYVVALSDSLWEACFAEKAVLSEYGALEEILADYIAALDSPVPAETDGRVGSPT